MGRLLLGSLLALATTVAAAQAPLAELGFPPLAEFDHRTGAFAVRFAVLPPDAEPAAMLARLTDDGRRPAPADRPVELGDELFFVYVPETYRPDIPHGVVVWISPTDFGGVRRADLRRQLDARRLIWIGAHRAGNERPALDRHALALVAAETAPHHWTIDPERVFVAGYSGGGRTASQLALLWPERFAGGLFVMGCNWYATLPVPGQPGRVWTASFPPPERAALRTLRRDRRFVFLTAEGDFNRDQTRATEAAARSDGFRHTLYLEAPGIDHYGAPPVELWRRALAFLDGEED